MKRYNEFMSDQMISDVEQILLSRGAVEAFLFGSMSRGDDRPDSDVDILVKFDRNKKTSLFDLVSIQNELERKIGKNVDLITKLNKHVEPYVQADLKKII